MSTTVKVLHLHKDEVWKILWSRDGNVLVSASRDGMMVIWSVPSVSCLLIFADSSTFNSCPHAICRTGRVTGNRGRS